MNPKTKNSHSGHNINDKQILKEITCCLAGNPNVGKSVIFNQLTGLSQVVGNWPGKTVKRAEGYSIFNNYKFHIIDLPGIYSLSTYSLEEIVSREYIIDGKPDYIINVVDANYLERNLFFTIQLLLLNRPIIIALNQYDILQKRGYEIDVVKLEELLGVPVIPTVAIHNRGVHEILEKIIEMEEGKCPLKAREIKFGKEIETKLKAIENQIESKFRCNCPSRFMAIKLLEKDENMIERLLKKAEPIESTGETENNSMPTTEVINKKKMILKESEKYCEELENEHGEDISVVLNAEIYNISSQITEQVMKIRKPTRSIKWHNFVDHITIHSIFGYFILFLIIFGSYALIFQLGDFISGIFDSIFEWGTPWAESVLKADSIQYKIIWNGLIGGFLAGVGGVLPYVIPFYFVLEILQDTGYLPRAAYLMDKFMHTIGVHGKSIIPVLLGFGCNVPAVSAARIMETEKERKRAILLSTLIPCSATTTIVLGLVGHYLGLLYAFILYILNFCVLIIIGKFMKKLDKEIESELIIELHDFRKPNFKVIVLQTWRSSKEFIYRALPLIVILGVVIQILIETESVDFINIFLSPVTVSILGLPIGIGVFLFYGVLRKELNLVLLQIYVTSLGLTMPEYMSSIQMFVFTMVTMLYIPCIATIIVIGREINWKFALKITIAELLIAMVIGGILNWGFKLIVFLASL
ncbi:MAG: ferrous iron transport protein B [Promethearchaeota archaeon]